MLGDSQSSDQLDQHQIQKDSPNYNPRQANQAFKYSFFNEDLNSDDGNKPQKSQNTSRFWEKQKIPIFPEPQQLQQEGYLQCLSKEITWKTFYFRLYHRKFLYYNSPNDSQEKGYLELNFQFKLEFSKFQRFNEVFYSFILSKNGFSQEFCSKDRAIILNWISFLHNYVCRIDYSDIYEHIDHIGSGNFAEVHKVQNILTQKMFAAKVFFKDKITPQIKKSIKKELIILHTLKGQKNILQLEEIFEEEDLVIIITELLEGGDLYSLLKEQKHFSEALAQQIFGQIVNALSIMKAKRVVHRDLKLENILLTNKNIKKDGVKVADFGLADIFSKKKNHMKTRCGTPGYMAPEIFSSKGYNEKVDIFSAGIILYTLLNGTPPFKGKDMKTIVKKTCQDKIRFTKSHWQNVTNEVHQKFGN